ncbi:hypothetical protein RCL1_008424 [Eukaryota sp. TZLM3-RCL]
MAQTVSTSVFGSNKNRTISRQLLCRVIKSFENNISVSRKRTVKFPTFELLVEKFLEYLDNEDVFLSDALLLSIGIVVRERLGILPSELHCSTGWLQKLKVRQGYRLLKICGEAKSADVEGMKEALPGILSRIGEFRPEDVYNLDETALYWKLKPGKRITKRKKVPGEKKSKDRLTVTLATNTDGSEKLPLLVIGRAKRPAALRQFIIPNNVMYRGNAKGWMTAELFEEYCDSVNKKMQRENRKILLIIDNVSSHKIDKHFDNVELLFLPPNTTSIMQPIDQGIVLSFKSHYRKKVVERDFY